MPVERGRGDPGAGADLRRARRRRAHARVGHDRRRRSAPGWRRRGAAAPRRSGARARLRPERPAPPCDRLSSRLPLPGAAAEPRAAARRGPLRRGLPAAGAAPAASDEPGRERAPPHRVAAAASAVVAAFLPLPALALPPLGRPGLGERVVELACGRSPRWLLNSRRSQDVDRGLGVPRAVQRDAVVVERVGVDELPGAAGVAVGLDGALAAARRRRRSCRL